MSTAKLIIESWRDFFPASVVATGERSKALHGTFPASLQAFSTTGENVQATKGSPVSNGRAFHGVRRDHSCGTSLFECAAPRTFWSRLPVGSADHSHQLRNFFP